MATEKAQRKRDLILEKAKMLFIQRGYAATSMDELVKFTGASKGSIYYHFDSKEDLFIQLLAKQNQEWMEAWHEKKAKYGSFEEKLYGIADHMVDDFQNPLTKVAEEFYINQPNDNTLLNKLLAILQGPRALYLEILEEGADQGIISPEDIEEVSVIFGSLLDGLSTTFYERSQEELRMLYRKGVSIFLQGVMTGRAED
ncbi:MULTISPECIES: TetR/AcrR family transcriptional regulator [Paenibacillus]|uniref:AcrR family transcriptional regulator n=2 Tax=Bacilli TaxID=91061 RepID=A0ABS4F4F3_9BACL|nr:MULTISPECIES: TetR/AcrR family transcriptional regulator [Paenibacillus]MBP1891116.1 AcrR family transcriptional regulator [Paenibacillus lactis]MCM3493570.1 TetR/AcrR family transcriptional regulator [Paenibacillus lactis]GIO92681.1 TetR family transcriptional regulator [Paenibacillus lactis]HAG00461.1 TetR family transcriptional regulator [Paenibacillus lactis]